MKAIFQGTLSESKARIERLRLRGIYACLSGCQSSGYGVLVREAVAGSCKEDDGSQPHHAGGNA
jgi:hypothetical protein